MGWRVGRRRPPPAASRRSACSVTSLNRNEAGGVLKSPSITRGRSPSSVREVVGEPVELGIAHPPLLDRTRCGWMDGIDRDLARADLDHHAYRELPAHRGARGRPQQLRRDDRISAEHDVAVEAVVAGGRGEWIEIRETHQTRAPERRDLLQRDHVGAAGAQVAQDRAVTVIVGQHVEREHAEWRARRRCRRRHAAAVQGHERGAIHQGGETSRQRPPSSAQQEGQRHEHDPRHGHVRTRKRQEIQQPEMAAETGEQGQCRQRHDQRRQRHGTSASADCRPRCRRPLDRQRMQLQRRSARCIAASMA